jgi:hypothetical protein
MVAERESRQLASRLIREHPHSALGLLTPQTVHYGRSPEVLARRQHVLTAAYQAHPERFVRPPPRPPQLPAAVWINPPAFRPMENRPLYLYPLVRDARQRLCGDLER